MTTKKKRIINAYNGAWGYEDIPFNKYDEAVIVPHFSLYDGKGSAVELNELKKTIKVGKTYRVKPSMVNKRLKAKLVAIYSDPISFGNKGKNTPVRLMTEWEFLDPIGSYPKGKHETIEDMNIEYSLRSKKRQKVMDAIWHKHGMKTQSGLAELKQLIRDKKVRF